MKSNLNLVVGTFLLLTLPVTLNAVVNIDFTEVGEDVLVEVSGQLDVTGVTATIADFQSADRLWGAAGLFSFNSLNSVSGLAFVPTLTDYTLFSGFPLDNFTDVTGEPFLINSDTLYLSAGYAGESISAQGTLPGISLSSLELKDGVEGVLFTFASTDTIRIRAGSAVPEPSSFSLIGGLTVMGLTLIQRRRAANSPQAQAL